MIKKGNLYFPTERFKKRAWLKDPSVYQEAARDPVKFWESLADKLYWQKKWRKGFRFKLREFSWFVGGGINITSNIFEHNPQGWKKIKDKLALIWEPEPVDEEPRKLTYKELFKEVCKFANSLKKLGVKKGDRVGIYLPMIPEIAIVMLACARIGAVHSVVFSAFSPQALRIRLQDTEGKILITADGYYRRGKIINLKKNADQGVRDTKVEKVIVVKRARNEIPWNKKRDVWYKDLIKNESDHCQAEPMNSEDTLFILYTSGCCHQDTLIQLKNGEIKKISELVEKGGSDLINVNLDKLKEEAEPITNKYKYYWPLRLWKIQTPLSTIMVTPNHPFFVLKGDGSFEEVEAKDLQESDQILQITKINVKTNKQRLLHSKIKYNQEKCTYYPSNKPEVPQFLNPGFAQILGYFAGDGHLTSSDAIVTDKDKENLLFYKSLIEKELKVKTYIRKRTRQRLIIHSAYLARYLKSVFPEVFIKSHKRKVPSRIQKSQNKCVAAFIRGFFDAEGSATGDSVKITSQSKELIQMLQLLLLRFGVIAKYFEEKRETHFGKKHQYKILVFGLKITDRESLKTFKQEVSFSSKVKMQALDNLLRELREKKVASMIRQLPINSLARLLRKTIKLPKKECHHKTFLDSYIYTNRRIKTDRLPQIRQYLKQKIKLIRGLNLSGRKRLNSMRRKEIKTAISLFKVPRKRIAEISGKAYETVHQYLDAKRPHVSEKSLNKFYKSFLPYLSDLKKKKLKILNKILKRVERLERLKDVGFFEIKKIKQVKNNSDLVYDLTALKNHNYIANSFVVHNSTGKPKGCVHVCGGYTVQAYWTGRWIFDFHPKDVFWCTADVGWVTGHTYGVYSPLLNGVPSLIYEGGPDWPNLDRWADIIEEHKVTIFYTAPTAVRMFEKHGTELVRKHNFETLRLIGSVGEPIDEAAWEWYFKEVGKSRCPLVDTWWQTETGGILITSLPGIGPFKPAFTGLPFPGIKFAIFDERGNPCPAGKEGNLVMLAPFAPGLLRGIYKNPKKYQETYWRQYGAKIYFTSDNAFKDKNGLIRIVGRADDVIKVAGHRLTTGELEAAINLHPDITECAVIGIPHEIKGEVPVAFVISKVKTSPEEIKEEIIKQVREKISPIAKPEEVYLVEELPKTRSGKIMRRILRKLFTGEDLGDLSTLANPESVEKIKQILSKLSWSLDKNSKMS